MMIEIEIIYIRYWLVVNLLLKLMTTSALRNDPFLVKNIRDKHVDVT